MLANSQPKALAQGRCTQTAKVHPAQIGRPGEVVGRGRQDIIDQAGPAELLVVDMPTTCLVQAVCHRHRAEEVPRDTTAIQMEVFAGHMPKVGQEAGREGAQKYPSHCMDLPGRRSDRGEVEDNRRLNPCLLCCAVRPGGVRPA